MVDIQYTLANYCTIEAQRYNYFFDLFTFIGPQIYKKGKNRMFYVTKGKQIGLYSNTLLKITSPNLTLPEIRIEKHFFRYKVLQRR